LDAPKPAAAGFADSFTIGGKMSRTGRILGRVAIGLGVAAVVVVAAVLIWFKAYLPGSVAPRSFPKIEGELRLSGLQGPVDVYRDKMGIPHIYASSPHDLFFAQGYVHAQERFWQMDAWRHIGSGTLSEMFGKGQLKTDAFLRTLGWKQVAEKEFEGLGSSGKEILLSYADGVNAWLKDHGATAASLEYAILGLLSPSYKIQPWTPVNSLTWGKAMAWDLGGNMSDEIERAILLKTLKPAEVAELFPDYPSDYPVIVPRIGRNPPDSPASAGSVGAGSTVSALPSLAALQAVSDNLGLVSRVLGPTGPDIGSNSWVVAGKLTSTGKPFLANDMHLGIQMPSIWIENDLHCTGAESIDVTGFSFAGVPGVIAGHNDRIAWGFTNLGPDVQDLFIEKVNPADPGQYEVDGKWVDFETRKETISVAGGPSTEITVRVSRHGPIVSDTYAPLKDRVDAKAKTTSSFRDRSGVELPANYAIALAWTALSPSTPFEAIWGFDEARNWEQFRKAAMGFAVPAQNLIYADVDGNIGYQTPGRIPIRKKGDGTLPVPGWTGEYDWNGYIPFEKLPWVLNPESGFVATANNQANPRNYEYLVTKDWDYGQRASRIVDMIRKAPGKIDAAYIQGMHGDSKNLNAETLVPVLLSVKVGADAAALRDKYLAGWNFQESADSKAATVFETFWSNLLLGVFRDKLPAGMAPEGGGRWYVVMRNLIAKPDSPWWDDRSTTGRTETRDDRIGRAFEETVASLEKKYGKDLATLPAWGALHTSTFRNQTLGESGIGLIEDLFNRGPFVTGGGKSVVNATGWTVGKSFEVDWLPSEREIVDLSNLDASLATHTTGESGHAYYKHYDDMIPLWAGIKYYAMWWNRSSVEKDAEGHLRLLP
jgi:penicillin amidase